MSDKSGIEWTEATWNPATGCTKVSPGCKFCYAKHKAWPRLSANPKGVYTGRKFEDVQMHPERLEQPLRWTRPRMIFVNSMSDLFHEAISDCFIDYVFAVMAMASDHTFQVLTKRPERMADYMADPEREARWASHVGVLIGRPSFRTRHFCILHRRQPWIPLPNVWLGTSVENQATADERIPHLLETPAAVRWLSCEPLLDFMSLVPLNWFGERHDPLGWLRNLDWIVVGGESGKRARPMEASWAEWLLNECHDADVPFFFKQGSQANWPQYHDFDSFPRSLQVREYPLC